MHQVVKELRQSLKDVNIIAYTDLRGLLGLLVQFSARHGVPASESGAHARESETSMVLPYAKTW